MKLRTKTLMIVGATLVLLTAGFYVTARFIVLDSFSDVEHREGTDAVTTVESAITNDVARIQGTTADWAYWDDTYQFVEDGNPEYVDTNLTNDAFATLGINLMVFVDRSGNVLYAKLVNLEDGTQSAPSDASLSRLLEAHQLYQFDNSGASTSGIADLPEGTMLVASRTVLTSDRQGPSKASLIMGRYLDETELAELRRVTGLDFTVYAAGDRAVPGDVVAASSRLASGPLVEPLGDDSLAGYSRIEDIQGHPALYIRTLISRDAYAQGQRTLWYLLGALALTSLTFAVVTMLLLERTVLSRLARLRNQVAAIAGGGARSARVTVNGGDEVGELAKAMNSLLDKVEESHRGRDVVEAQLKQLNRELEAERIRVEGLNKSLEDKVTERTQDLQAVNEQLLQRHRQLMDARAQAARDPLTALGNHRAFHQRIRQAVEGNEDPVGLLIIDIDYFKSINDSHGHLAGDDILRGLAAALRELGMGDNAFRYGGDEFAIILPGENQSAALASAEQVRLAVQTALDGHGNVTVSVGAASYPETADSAEQLIYGADSAMYWAKSAGKNRVGDWAESRIRETATGRGA